MGMFLIELPDSKEFDDLVFQMASFVQANYWIRITKTLETANEQLARAVAGLTGQILMPMETENEKLTRAVAEQIPTSKETLSEANDWLEKRLDQLLVGVDFAKGSDVGTTVEAEEKNGGLVLADENTEPDPSSWPGQDIPALSLAPLSPPGVTGSRAAEAAGRGKSAAEAPATGRFCEFCGEPVGIWRKICGKQECLSKRQKRSDAAWKAKHKLPKVDENNVIPADSIPAAVNPEETPGVEVPLDGQPAAGIANEIGSSPVEWPKKADYQVMSGALKGTFLAKWEVLEKGQNGDLEPGCFLLSKDGRRGRLEMEHFPVILYVCEK